MKLSVPRPPVTPERYLFRCTGIALWGGTLLVFLMLLPLLAVKMNQGGLIPDATALKTQSMISFTPVFFSLAAMVSAIFLSAAQNKFFAAWAGEHKRASSEQQLKNLRFPFLRAREILRLAGDQKYVKESLICSALFWASTLILGVLSPLPVYFLAASAGLFFAAAKRMTGNQRTRIILRIWTELLIVVFCFGSIAGVIRFFTEGSPDAPGIPRSRDELAAMIYQKSLPHAEFTRFTDAPGKPEIRKTFVRKLNDAQFYYALPASFKAERSKALANASARSNFARIEKMIDSGSVLQYDFKLQNRYLWHPGTMPCSSNRECVNWFTEQIFEALEKNDPQRAMLSFRRLTAFQDSIQNGDFLISLSYSSIFEENRMYAAGAMIGSGLLSQKDLDFIAASNAQREEKLRNALINTLKCEARFEQELIDDMSKLYPWMQSAETRQDEALYENRLLAFLLRGDLVFPPLIWDKVMIRKAKNLSDRKFTVWLHFLQDIDFNQWDKEFRESLERTLKKESSYFAILNYQSQNRIIRQFYRAVTCTRLVSAALRIEGFRRKYNRMPRSLSEVIPGAEIPKDAETGKKITLKQGKFTVPAFTKKGLEGKLELQGWQLCASESLSMPVPQNRPLPSPPEFL